MKEWKSFSVGDKVRMIAKDFDGTEIIDAVIVEVYKDHVIAFGNDMNLWIDKDTCNMFEKVS